MIAAVVDSATPFLRQMSAEHRQFLVGLMHQQLYVLGRDIVSCRGNLLLQYGCHKQVSPYPGIPSIYFHRPKPGVELAFRGFGVFVGSRQLGGIFIRRFVFQPRWMPSSIMPPNVWLLRDLPPGSAPRSYRDQHLVGQLICLMSDWFAAYESWVRHRLGHRFRLGQLLHFRKLGPPVIYPDLAIAWRSVRQWFAQVLDPSEDLTNRIVNIQRQGAR